MPSEADESLTQGTLSHTTTALHRYVSNETRQQFVPAFETAAVTQMTESPDQGLRIVWFRGLLKLAESAAGLAKLKALLNDQLSVTGVELRELDRWNMVTGLIALGDPESDAMLAAERQRDRSGDAQEYAYVAEAARPDRGTKEKYFDDYMQNASRPEDWVDLSLSAFNYWNQSALTEAYLKPALDALVQIKRDRKIFFLLRWLNSFVGGQQSPAAQEQVHEYLKTASIDQDLQLKILQVVDELDRTVAIRRAFP